MLFDLTQASMTVLQVIWLAFKVNDSYCLIYSILASWHSSSAQVSISSILRVRPFNTVLKVMMSGLTCDNWSFISSNSYKAYSKFFYLKHVSNRVLQEVRSGRTPSNCIWFKTSKGFKLGLKDKLSRIQRLYWYNCYFGVCSVNVVTCVKFQLLAFFSSSWFFKLNCLNKK